jgi:hypothetical protein
MTLSTPAKIAVVAGVVAALAIGAVLAFGVLRLVGERHKENCIAEANARYPARVIQNPSRLGRPEIVTSIAELRSALDDCEATAF